MKVGYYKGEKYYLNELFMEIWKELPDSTLRKVRNFKRLESLIQWEREDNILARECLRIP